MSWFEGGIRTSAWVTGGVLPLAMRGKTLSSAHLIAVCDWHSTFLALAFPPGAAGTRKGHDDDGDGETPQSGGGGVLQEEKTRGAAADHPLMTPPPPLPTLDGIDQWPVISGARNAFRSLFWSLIEPFFGPERPKFETIVLPRQARDKRWGKTEKKGAFFAGERTTPLRSEVFVGSDVLILGAVIAFFGEPCCN